MSCMAGTFAAGRIVNLRTACSQHMGNMIWGMASTLLVGSARSCPWLWCSFELAATVISGKPKSIRPPCLAGRWAEHRSTTRLVLGCWGANFGLSLSLALVRGCPDSLALAGGESSFHAVQHMARPVCKCFLTIWSGQSAPTCPVSERCSGQDGAPRVLVLTSTSASSTMTTCCCRSAAPWPSMSVP